MYIFGYKTTVFIQNLYILVKFFGKNFIFSVKITIFFVFSGPDVHFSVQNYSFYPKFVHFGQIFGKNFIFRVKSTNCLFFSGPNVHFWIQNYSFYPKFVHFSEIVWQKLHF